MKRLDNAEKACVEAALNKLLNGCTFYICDLNNIAEMVGSEPRRSPRYKFLRGLHCIKYADMSPDLRNSIPAMVLECLRPDTVDPAAVMFAVLAEGRQLPTVEDRYLDQLPSQRAQH